MKINTKFELYLTTKGYDNLTRKKNQDVKKDGEFYLINFHPVGEPEAFICCVAKGSK